MIRDVTDLDVYNNSLDLLRKLYELLGKLPRSEYDTVNQSQRASKSISANIAEGFAKKSSGKEFKRFLLIALGSSDEMVTHLRTICITTPRLKDEAEVLMAKYISLSKRINKLHSSWR